MPYINWSTEFSVHHAGMDAQHQQLFDYVNAFYDAVAADARQATLLGIFTRIVQFTANHFRDEEAMMARVGYDGLNRHRLIHQQLVTQVMALDKRLRQNDPAVAHEIEGFLKHWLTAHIKGIDMKYGTLAETDTGNTRAA